MKFILTSFRIWQFLKETGMSDLLRMEREDAVCWPAGRFFFLTNREKLQEG